MKKFLYWDWIKAEALKVGSDGCSKVPDFYLGACRQHDLAYFYAKDPRSAYTHQSWALADHITKGGADIQFRQTIQKKSTFGVLSPMSWWRWLGLKLFGSKAWNSHADTHIKDNEDARTT